MRIPGKVFVITGAGDGIGRQVALMLLWRGARVAAVDIREESLAETRRLAGSAADRLSTHVLDICDRAAVEALPEQVLDVHGKVDALLNVAGIIQPFLDLDDLSWEQIDHVMGVNFGGTLNTVKVFLPLLRKRPEAVLLNVSSIGALVPVPGQGAYSASKAAVKMLTECLYAELGGTAVTVIHVIPGGVGTNISANSGVVAPQVKQEGALSTTPVEEAATQIIDAVEKGTFRVLIGSPARRMDLISRVSPTRAISLVAQQMGKLRKAG